MIFSGIEASAILAPTLNSLLNQEPQNRDDGLPWLYLASRLGVETTDVPRPSTKVVGIKRLAYFDASLEPDNKPFLVGKFPAAVFETMDRDDRRHAHRIYLSSNGLSKAELGLTPNGTERNPKKSARKVGKDNTGGRSVIWGDPSKATAQVICEGIETAAAVALAFQTEINDSEFAVAACINAAGIEAFKPWPATTRIIVGADRDECVENGKRISRRGEIAARGFAQSNCSKISVAIALPGIPGEDVDWLDVLRRDGIEAVRSGILAGQPCTPDVAPPNKPQEFTSLPEEDAAEIERLANVANVSPLAYDREREPAAKRLKCRVTTLDELVSSARGGLASPPGQGHPIDLPDVALWSEAVNAAVLLNEVSTAIRQYVIVTAEQADAIALYVVHAHAHDAHDFSPVLNLKSAQKRSGKSRLMQVLDRMVPRALLVSNIKPAALLRIIELKQPTLLFDEVDAAMKQDRELNEAYRGIINSAFSRAGARFIMNVPLPGGGYEPRQFSTWAPLVLSGIGDLPDTVRDRSIEIDMVRKRRDEQVRRLRRNDGSELNVLAQMTARWVRDNFARLQVAEPNMPQSLNDRAADAWEPLFAVAELAGDDWPARVQKAALSLSGEQNKEDNNLVTQLLADIREVFTDEQIKSQVLIEKLAAMEGHPWSEFGRNAKPINQNQLARLLKPYKIWPGTIRVELGRKGTAKGYRLAQFAEVFARYLPDSENETVTPSQGRETADFLNTQPGTTRSDVTGREAQKPPYDQNCDGVTDRNSPEEAYSDLAPEEETAL